MQAEKNTIYTDFYLHHHILQLQANQLQLY